MRDPFEVVRDGPESGIMGYCGLRHSSPPKEGRGWCEDESTRLECCGKARQRAVVGAIWICRPTREARRDNTILDKRWGIRRVVGQISCSRSSEHTAAAALRRQRQQRSERERQQVGCNDGTWTGGVKET